MLLQALDLLGFLAQLPYDCANAWEDKLDVCTNRESIRSKAMQFFVVYAYAGVSSRSFVGAGPEQYLPASAASAVVSQAAPHFGGNTSTQCGRNLIHGRTYT